MCIVINNHKKPFINRKPRFFVQKYQPHYHSRDKRRILNNFLMISKDSIALLRLKQAKF